jgi:hypothetical protein
VTIFTEGASYHERVMGEPIRGRDGIRDYWQTKVALLTFDGPLISSLREYWASEVVELSPAAPAHQQRSPNGG